MTLRRIPGRWRPGGGGGSVSTTYPLSGTSSLTSVDPPHCGKLARSSSTALTFTPFNGDLIRIQGVLYQIPSAGIAGLANTSVFVNGSSGSSLSASTLYYVYAFINSGTVTADFSTTAHATSSTAGNIGTEVKSGDETRTLIGMIRTNGSSQFVDSNTQRFVLSYYNRRAVVGVSNNTATRSTSSTTFVEFNSEMRVEFLCWSDEVTSAHIVGSGYPGAGSTTIYFAIAFDDGTTPENGMCTLSDGTGGAQRPIACSAFRILSEGYHFATISGAADSSTSNLYWISANNGKRSALYVRVMG